MHEQDDLAGIDARIRRCEMMEGNPDRRRIACDADDLRTGGTRQCGSSDRRSCSARGAIEASVVALDLRDRHLPLEACKCRLQSGAGADDAAPMHGARFVSPRRQVNDTPGVAPGAALLRELLARRWLTGVRNTRALRLTAAGRGGLNGLLGLTL